MVAFAKMPTCHKVVVKLSVICHLRAFSKCAQGRAVPLAGVEVMDDYGILGFGAPVFACWEMRRHSAPLPFDEENQRLSSC